MRSSCDRKLVNNKIEDCSHTSSKRKKKKKKIQFQVTTLKIKLTIYERGKWELEHSNILSMLCYHHNSEVPFLRQKPAHTSKIHIEVIQEYHLLNYCAHNSSLFKKRKKETSACTNKHKINHAFYLSTLKI